MYGDAFKNKAYNLFLHCPFYSLVYRKTKKEVRVILAAQVIIDYVSAFSEI